MEAQAARPTTDRANGCVQTRPWLTALCPRCAPRRACAAHVLCADGLQLISLSSTHALVHRQHQAHPHKVVKCQHLNGTRMLAAAFDPVRVHRAYAVNDAGQLLLLSVPYDNKLTSCKVRVCVGGRKGREGHRIVPGTTTSTPRARWGARGAGQLVADAHAIRPCKLGEPRAVWK